MTLFMTVAGHMSSEFVIIHDIDSILKSTAASCSIYFEFFIVHEIDSFSIVFSISWLMTLAASGDKFVMIHDIDLMISQGCPPRGPCLIPAS